MKVQLAVVKAEFRETRALEPHMYGRPFPADSRLADILEVRSKGRIRKIDPAPALSHVPEPKRRGRPPKAENAKTTRVDAPNGKEN